MAHSSVLLTLLSLKHSILRGGGDATGSATPLVPIAGDFDVAPAPHLGMKPARRIAVFHVSGPEGSQRKAQRSMSPPVSPVGGPAVADEPVVCAPLCGAIADLHAPRTSMACGGWHCCTSWQLRGAPESLCGPASAPCSVRPTGCAAQVEVWLASSPGQPPSSGKWGYSTRLHTGGHVCRQTLARSEPLVA